MPLRLPPPLRVPLVLVVLVAAPECAPPRSHALPSVSAFDPSTYTPTDVISYRTLTRDDFRAVRPPAQVADHAGTVGAFTCVTVIPQGPIPVRIEPVGDGFVARAGSLVVRAEMDRSCSWWNDASRPVRPPGYVLQHEQIHFAIAELAAREMERRGRMLQARGATIEEAHSAFQRELDRLSGDTGASSLERHAALDRETSAVYDVAAQQRWYDRVAAELAR